MYSYLFLLIVLRSNCVKYGSALQPLLYARVLAFSSFRVSGGSQGGSSSRTCCVYNGQISSRVASFIEFYTSTFLFTSCSDSTLSQLCLISDFSIPIFTSGVKFRFDLYLYVCFFAYAAGIKHNSGHSSQGGQGAPGSL